MWRLVYRMDLCSVASRTAGKLAADIGCNPLWADGNRRPARAFQCAALPRLANTAMAALVAGPKRPSIAPS